MIIFYDHEYIFTSKLSSLEVGKGGLKFLVSLTYRCNIRYLVKIGPVVLEKEMLTEDDGHQAIAKCYVNDSGHRET